MIYITGDTHNPLDISKMNTTLFPQQAEMTKEDYVIILGDFGLYWHEDKTFRHWHKWLQEKPWTTLWLDGNHENHDWLNSMEVSEWHGGKVHKDGSIIHLMRGQVFEIEGQSFWVLGGADSTDKEYRREGISWWPQEVPSWAEFNEAVDNLEKVGNKVDYILTHTCPIDLIRPMFHLNPIGYSTVEKALQLIYNHNPEFKRWFFGHWHQSRDFSKFTCLYNRVIRLDEYKVKD